MDIRALDHAASTQPPLGAERSGRRDLMHGVTLIAPWCGLVWLWWRVLRGGGGLEFAGSVVATCVVVTFVVTIGWVRHNLSINRRKGPRRGLPSVELDYSHDWTGRPVSAEWAAVGSARVVVVAATDDHKVFLPDPGPSRAWGVDSAVADRSVRVEVPG